MFPRLFNWNAETFSKLGIGVLSDCISCEVTEAINDIYELTMRYKFYGACADELNVRNIIAAKANDWQPIQAFRIYKVRRTAPSEITVYARHISYDLSGYPIAPFIETGIDAVMTKLNASLVTPFPFTITTTLEDSTTAMESRLPTSIKSCMGGKAGTVTNLFGGEWEYDNFKAVLRPRRGDDKGVRVTYGTNLAAYEKERSDNVYSHCIAYYKYRVANHDAIIVGDPIRTGITSITRCVYYDASRLFNSVPEVSDLNSAAAQYISENTALDSQTVKASILETQQVELGDTVHIKYDKDIFDTRIVKMTWDVLTEKYTKLELGTLSQSVASTIQSVVSGGSGSAASGSSSIAVDDTLSSTSENPVQNKVINAALGTKVDKVSGKGLSTNDFTDTLKNKLDGIASGAEVNVQSDWNQTDSSADDFIKNKPGANSSDIIEPTLTTVENHANFGNTHYYKISSRVHVHIGVKGLTANTNTAIFTLPSGFRPLYKVNATGNGGTLSSFSSVTVNTNGVVQVYSPNTYCTADLEFDVF